MSKSRTLKITLKTSIHTGRRKGYGKEVLFQFPLHPDTNDFIVNYLYVCKTGHTFVAKHEFTISMGKE